MIERHLKTRIVEALNTFPVIFINGPRQAGKTTLVQHLADTQCPADYVSFDDFNYYRAAETNPESFLRAFKGRLIIDEVQLVPQMFRTIKLLVDEIRQTDKANANGRYLLTGSANVMSLPELSDALVGRMCVLPLHPLSAVEISEGRGDFLNRILNNDFHIRTTKSDIDLTEIITRATFPEISNWNETDRKNWFDAYTTTLLQREIKQITSISKAGVLPNLLSVLAGRTGGLLNDADIARTIKENPVTTKNYRFLLQMIYLTFDIQPWFRNIGKRLVKSPKCYISDTSLLCFLQQIDLAQVSLMKPDKFGHLFENFVATELKKQISLSKDRIGLHHFRTSDNNEVDFVLEASNGLLVGIETKCRDSVTEADFKGLKVLQDQVKNDFVCGIVLYSGHHLVPFGDKLWAVPIAELWA